MSDKRGAQCCAFGCGKHKKSGSRSDSEGSNDDSDSDVISMNSLHTIYIA